MQGKFTYLLFDDDINLLKSVGRNRIVIEEEINIRVCKFDGVSSKVDSIRGTRHYYIDIRPSCARNLLTTDHLTVDPVL